MAGLLNPPSACMAGHGRERVRSKPEARLGPECAALALKLKLEPMSGARSGRARPDRLASAEINLSTQPRVGKTMCSWKPEPRMPAASWSNSETTQTPKRYPSPSNEAVAPERRSRCHGLAKKNKVL